MFVGECEQILDVAVVPLHRDLDLDPAARCPHGRFVPARRTRSDAAPSCFLFDVLDEAAHARRAKREILLLAAALVDQADPHTVCSGTRARGSRFAQDVVVELDVV